ncbi:hypothetical protein C0Q58_26255 [Streptomyces albidoflavus]|nr:hypothetical protein C0Q58_26255 [Streptomyces albidoflavus]
MEAAVGRVSTRITATTRAEASTASGTNMAVATSRAAISGRAPARMPSATLAAAAEAQNRRKEGGRPWSATAGAVTTTPSLANGQDASARGRVAQARRACCPGQGRVPDFMSPARRACSPARAPPGVPPPPGGARGAEGT